MDSERAFELTAEQIMLRKDRLYGYENLWLFVDATISSPMTETVKAELGNLITEGYFS
jgi:hypothetical protein